MELDFSGKIALVTGAAQGIGLAIVKKLVSCGAKVIAVDVNESELKAVTAQLPGVDTLVVDLSDWNATSEALNRVSGINLVVNNAGVIHSEFSEQNIDRTLQVNLKAVMNISQHVVKGWISEKKTGAIVNIASIAAVRPSDYNLAYNCSKAAVVHFTRCLALECAPYDIRVNAVSPGVVRTKLLEQVIEEAPDIVKEITDKVPSKEKLIEPEDIANAVVFLLCDQLARKITGVNLPVDSGYLIT